MKYSLYAQMEAKPGKETEAEEFLRSALPLVNQEPQTIAWFAIRMSPSKFGIFDVFNDESGREAHLSGKVAAALMERAPDLFTATPKIFKADVLEVKFPDQTELRDVA